MQEYAIIVLYSSSTDNAFITEMRLLRNAITIVIHIPHILWMVKFFPFTFSDTNAVGITGYCMFIIILVR